MASEFEFSVIDGMYVFVYPGEGVSDASWNRYIDHLQAFLRGRNNEIAGLRTLVFTDGGGPDVRQRGKLNDVLDGRATPVAVVSGNFAVRAILAPMSWFNPEIKLFAPKDVLTALAFLKVPAADTGRVFSVLHELNHKLATPLKTVSELPVAPR
jgi:hypothetical protein